MPGWSTYYGIERWKPALRVPSCAHRHDRLIPLRFLIAESETPDQRTNRRADVGRSAGESYAATLRQLCPTVSVCLVRPSDDGAQAHTPQKLSRFDAVFLTGSPLHIYCDTPENRRQIDFMRAVFASGTPSFGSCAGLQVAVVAAGGQVGPIRQREVGLARRIVRTDCGRDHPLFTGRGVAWDAPSIHGDEVDALPPGATLLATNAVTRIQAVEIVRGDATFWGVQYHPELSMAEVAAALRREADEIVAAGLALTKSTVEGQAALFDALDTHPDRLDLRWQLGVDVEVAEERRRRTEIINFIRYLVEPTANKRGRLSAPRHPELVTA